MHPVLEGRGQRRIVAGHRSLPPPANSQTPRNGARRSRASGEVVALRPLAFYDAVGQTPRRERSRGMRGDALPAAPIERIRRHLVGLRMPRALETLDHVVQQLERGQIGAIEAIEALLAEELTIRESRRIKAALQMARLATIKTLSGFDFSFQPSLDRNRILALAAARLHRSP